MPGHDVPVPNATVEAPLVVQQQHDLAEKVAPAQQHVFVRAAPGSRGKAAFTLRLDPERHLKLRVMSALSHRSAQQIVTAALDAVLESQADTISSAIAPSLKG
jgi:hypothetical protein